MALILLFVTCGVLKTYARAVRGVRALVRNVTVTRVEFAVTHHPGPTELVTVGVTGKLVKRT